jgi:hypothetical protein
VRISRNNATIEDVVTLCENGFGYDVAIVIASLADLAEPLARPRRCRAHWLCFSVR